MSKHMQAERWVEIRASVHDMRRRHHDGQGDLASAMCRLSLPMAEELLDEIERLLDEAQKQAAETVVGMRENNRLRDMCRAEDFEFTAALATIARVEALPDKWRATADDLANTVVGRTAASHLRSCSTWLTAALKGDS